MAVLFMSFFMIPYSYFYAEEYNGDIYDIDYIPTTQMEKLEKALKKTVESSRKSLHFRSTSLPSSSPYS